MVKGRTFVCLQVYISWTEYRANVWVRQKIVVPEENGLLEQLKKWKLPKYGHWSLEEK